MNAFIHVDGKQLTVYPDFPHGKKGIFIVGCTSIIFLLCCLWIAMIPNRADELKLAGLILFSGWGLFVFLLYLTWGPLIVMNEHRVSLRPNPLLDRIEVQWDEIEAFLAFPELYYGFYVTLVPAQYEAFLQRQSSFMRRLLAKRLTRTGRIARFSYQILPCPQLDLLKAIEELYHVQLQKHHIRLEKEWEL